MKKPKNHIPGFGERLAAYAEENLLELHQYSPYHFRLMDSGYVVVDAWTTGRYYVVTTDYLALAGGGVERGGEKGSLPVDKLEEYLDGIFFARGEV